MKFILTAGWEDGVAALTERLVHELADGRKVLWLVSGGSNIQASVEIMEKISPKLSRNLTVMLIDERYGPAGHNDSNWTQLQKAGFKAKQATLLPVLEKDLSFEESVKKYRQMTAEAFDNNQLVVAQIGVGPDGHLAGILPDSPAATETKDLVVGYQNDPYTRLTMSFAAIRRIDAAYVFAFGEGKRPTLETLRRQDLPLSEQPAQILKELPEVYLFNDQVGEHH